MGAGLAGAVVARELAEAGFPVRVIDRRSHIAGNAYDEVNAHGIRVHKYGPHIFHTNNQRVVDWLSRFTTWIPYRHKVKAMLSDGRLVTLPVNRETKAIVGEANIVDTFFRPYTRKMWGLEIEQLSPDILNRVPVRDDLNEYYFPDDQFQAMPEHGYTAMVEKILDHALISVALDTSFTRSMEDGYEHVFNTLKLNVRFTVHEIEEVGDWAWVRTSSAGRTRVLAAGTEGDEGNNELFVFRREGGAWRIHRYLFATNLARG